jgi:DNA polymerase-4
MDAFFAAVEVLDNPALAGKPVLVGHDGPRGVVAAASYEARRFGCHSAQPMAVAKRNCPQAIVVSGRHHRYREMSDAVFSIFERFTPIVEPLSIDEAFLDVTGSIRLMGPAETIARNIKSAIRHETGLTASVGVAPNKFLAKLASDLQKPDGLVVIRREDVDRVLPPLPVSRLWGVGPKTAKRLADLNIRTIGDLRRLSPDDMEMRFGGDGEHYTRLAHGLDDRAVTPDHDARSIGQEETFETDVPDHDQLRQTLFAQAEQVGRRLRRAEVRAKHVWVKIRFGDFKTITRQCTLDEASDVTTVLYEAAKGLFDAWARESFQPVRLIGMAGKGLVHGEGQLALFPDPTVERQKKVDTVVDRVNEKLGKGALRRGGGIG